MASWSVFEPPSTVSGTLEAADKAVFMRDGFSLPAFLIAPIWLLWRRMWLVFLFWLAATIALKGLGVGLGLASWTMSGLSLIFAYGFALEANELRKWSLRRAGWRFAGIACGNNLTEAEYRHFEGYAFPAPAQDKPAAPRAMPATGGSDAILGVFPEPQGPRA